MHLAYAFEAVSLFGDLSLTHTGDRPISLIYISDTLSLWLLLAEPATIACHGHSQPECHRVVQIDVSAPHHSFLSSY